MNQTVNNADKKAKLLSPGFVKRSLASHSWLGLMVGLFMYLVCLSGTLAVFYMEFERWEQPTVAEYTDYDPATIQLAYERVLAGLEQDTHHMFVLLPTEEMPRTSISSDFDGHFINQDGTVSESHDHAWTEMLTNLHLYLHLPASFGMIVVSITGALLCALIISGFLSHPSIIRDAFSLRLQGSKRMEQVDIHNRLSVWAAPFHLMIAVTGAYFGLALLVSYLASIVYFDGDQQALFDTIYRAEPALQQEIDTANVARVLESMEEIAPEANPFYVTVEDVGTEAQYMLVGATHPGRLIYAEQYRFDAAGNYIDKIGYSDSEVGRQALFSVYRIHFGHFGGFLVKVLYGIFGLALTVVSVTGINIWLAKRKRRDALNTLWAGFVWGTPAALALSAIGQVLLGLPATMTLWLGLLAALILSQIQRSEGSSKATLQIITGILLLLLVICHGLLNQTSAFEGVALAVNLCITFTGLLFLWLGKKNHNTHTVMKVASIQAG